jgi:fibronectin-binding autotransporter adhesin
MKKLHFSRSRILHTIHAAAIALLLVATTAARAVPVATGDGHGNVTVSGSGTEFVYSGSAPNLASGGTLTVASGSTIANTVNPYILGLSGPAKIDNNGTLSVQSGSAYATPIYVFEATSGATTINNTGSLSAVGPGNSTNTAGMFIVNSGTGAVTLTNSGSSSGMGAQGYGVYLRSSGNVSLNNTSAGTLNGVGGSGSSAYLESTVGTVTATNSGTIGTTASRSGLELGNDTGAINAVNTGSVVGASGISTDSNGRTSVTNSGTVSGHYYSIYVEAGPSATIMNSGSVTGGTLSALYAGADTISVTNSASGTIAHAQIGIAAYQYGPGAITVLNAGSITSSAYGIVVSPQTGPLVNVTNSGTINVSDTGILLNGIGNVINSGSITGGTAAISVESGSSVTLSGKAATTGTIIGGATAASTSTLTFKLGIPSAQLAAAQAQLGTEIAAYDAQNGGAYTFMVDGRNFDVLNFLYDGGVTDDLVAVITRVYANTPGFHSLGLTLDGLNSSSAKGAAILKALGNVPDAGLPNALAELSPKSIEVFRNIAFDNNTFNNAQINNHLANLRDGLTGFDSSALTVNDPSMDPSLSQVKSHLLAYDPASTPGLVSDSSDALLGGTDMKDMKSAQVNTMPTDRWSSFIAGNVILADLSGNANLQDSNYTTGAVTAGVDYRLDNHFTVGALLAYAHTDIDLDNRNSSATVDSYTPGIYASYVDGGWYGNGMGSYVRNVYTDDRMIDIPGIGGDNHGATSGNQGNVNLTGGYEFHKGDFKFGPVASLEYVHLAIQSLQEQGPTSLNINEQDQDSLRTLFGFEGRFVANISTPMGAMSLTPHVSASWQHEYLDNSDGITSQFNGAGGGSFSVQTDTPQRDSAFFDVGLDATVNQNVTVFVDYEAQAGQDDFFAQSAQGGVRVGF